MAPGAPRASAAFSFNLINKVSDVYIKNTRVKPCIKVRLRYFLSSPLWKAKFSAGFLGLTLDLTAGSLSRIFYGVSAARAMQAGVDGKARVMRATKAYGDYNRYMAQ